MIYKEGPLSAILTGLLWLSSLGVWAALAFVLWALAVGAL